MKLKFNVTFDDNTQVSGETDEQGIMFNGAEIVIYDRPPTFKHAPKIFLVSTIKEIIIKPML